MLKGGHCQVPCGIFDDPRLVSEIREHCATIRKAIVKIHELSSVADGWKDGQAINQMSRWVVAKDQHGDAIVDTVANYCLCQRVKPCGTPGSPFATVDGYTAALAAHHAVLAAAVKVKQATGTYTGRGVLCESV